MNKEVQEYLSWKLVDHPKSAHNYSVWLTRFAEYTKKPIDQLEPMDFVRFRSNWDSKVKAATLSLAMLGLRDFVRYCFENQKIKMHYRYVPLVKEGQFGHHESVSPEEVDTMIQTALNQSCDLRSIRDAALISFLFDTGMRVGELVSLDVSSIDFDSRMGKVRTLKKRYKEEFRPFFWRERTHQLLGEYLKRKHALTSSAELFISLDKGAGFLGRITARAVQRLVKHCSRGINKHIVVHSFRHGFAINVIMKGGTNADVMNYLGHSNLEGTKHYTLFNPKEARERYYQLLEGD